MMTGNVARERVELSDDEQRLYERLREATEEDLRRMAKLLTVKSSKDLFGKTEFDLRDRVHELGAKALEMAAEQRQKRDGYAGASLVCPHCKCDARFVERRTKTYTSLLRNLRLNRCYYHCRACGSGHMPWVQELGLTDRSLTPAAVEITCLIGVQTSFAQASETTLRKASGLKLSESTVERTTEAAGERVARLRDARVQFGDRCTWKWRRAGPQMWLRESRRDRRATARPARRAEPKVAWRMLE